MDKTVHPIHHELFLFKFNQLNGDNLKSNSSSLFIQAFTKDQKKVNRVKTYEYLKNNYSP